MTASPAQAQTLRREVRDFLRSELNAGGFVPACDSWLSAADPEFSRRLAAKGWIGMVMPTEYGGHGRTALDRFVVTEELLCAGAPVTAHWFADRQVIPGLLRYGTEDQKRQYLPAIAAGELFFSIGMSEPDSGSDLASVRTRARKVPGGWSLSGTKLWTSGAHYAQLMLTLARSAPVSTHRHAGLSQFLVPLDADGVDVRPIRSLNGEHHFNEVVLEDVFVADEGVVGQVGEGWSQVTSELANERSGPERFMSTTPLLMEWIRMLRGSHSSELEALAVGRLLARLWGLRQMSIAVAAAIAAGEDPMVQAAVVKDLGGQFERDVVETIRSSVALNAEVGADVSLQRLLLEAIVRLPAFTLRGGTTEVLRGIVAKSLSR